MTGPLYLVTGGILTYAAYSGVLAEKATAIPFVSFLIGLLMLAAAVAIDYERRGR